MKGLNQFIVDLRQAKDSEEETRRINLELNNIRTKFNSSSSLNGYQKKKYICKLMYLYLMGYSLLINFGYKETIELVKSTTFSEKQLGYYAVGMLNDVNPGLIKAFQGNSPSVFKYKSASDRLNNLFQVMYPILLADLRSANEDVNVLAMQFIASQFNYDITNLKSDELELSDSDLTSNKWAEIVDIIYSFCTSPVQLAKLKQKAVAAFYTLAKLHSNIIIINSTWIPRLISLIDHDDFGVVSASIPLIGFLMELKPQYIKSILPSVAGKLKSVLVDKKCLPEYYYYDTPAPWFVVGLLLLVESFFLYLENEAPALLTSNTDATTLSNLRLVVVHSIQSASKPIKGLPNRNSQSAILFQSVSLAVFLDASPEAISGAIDALILLLQSNETNTRYLSLDALIKLTARSASSKYQTIDVEQLPQIFALLTDRDISIKRKALDLLYTVSNNRNYYTIVNKLLEIFPHTDFHLKTDVAIKVAILSEKFASDSNWYVTTMLRLLSLGGNSSSNGAAFISNEVWERIIQIIVNNENLHAMSAKLVVQLMVNPHMVNDKRNASDSGNGHSQVARQPVAISENLIRVAAFILGEYGHLIASDPETPISLQFQLLYNNYLKVPLTTRATILSSIMKILLKFPDEDFVPDIVDLFEIEQLSVDLEIQTRAHEYLKLATYKPDFVFANEVIRPLPPFESLDNALMNRLGSVRGVMGKQHRVLELLINNNNRISNYSTGSLVDIGNPFEGAKSQTPPPAPTILSPNWAAGYSRMRKYDAGIFYENQLIKITYRVQSEESVLRVKFTIFNNSKKTANTDITGLTILQLESKARTEDPSYVLNIEKPPESIVAEKTTMELLIKVRHVVDSNEDPIIHLKFTCGGSFNQLNLKFPIVFLKTLSPTAMASVDEFGRRWNQIGDLLGNNGDDVRTVSTSAVNTSSGLVRLLTRLRFSVVHATPDATLPILVMGAGILHSSANNSGLLVTVRSVDASGQRLEIHTRSTGGGVAHLIAETLVDIVAL